MEITICGLTKTFPGGVVALRDVTLTIGPGMCGLLGPNGAGKSTLMRILATLMEPDGGSIRVGDLDVRTEPQAVRQRLGYLPQEAGFYLRLTGREYLELVGGLKGLRGAELRRQADQALERVNLGEQAVKRIGSLSGGMKRRLGIAQALIGSPELIIVDEPTVGLDPEERLRFRNLLADLSRDRTVLFSTHIVTDVEDACSSLVVLRGGQIAYAGAPEGLAQLASGSTWLLDLDLPEYDRVRSTLQIVSARRAGEQMSLRVLAAENPFGSGVSVEPTLQDGYLFLMGEVPA